LDFYKTSILIGKEKAQYIEVLSEIEVYKSKKVLNLEVSLYMVLKIDYLAEQKKAYPQLTKIYCLILRN
jgi:hypothetical protein